MPNPDVRAEMLARKQCLQRRDFACTANDFNTAVLYHGDAGGIVAAVFQSL
jgi:hypothetical protein